MLQGSRLHRPWASSYTSAVMELSPPATMTHPPIAVDAKPIRASCIGGSGFHRSPSPSRVNTSHDRVASPLGSPPPKTAKRPSLSTHPLPSPRTMLVAGRYLHCQLPHSVSLVRAAPSPVPFHPSRRLGGSSRRKRRIRLASAKPNNPRDARDEKAEEVAKCTPLSPRQPSAPPIMIHHPRSILR
jgi:hypothetical protein